MRRAKLLHAVFLMGLTFQVGCGEQMEEPHGGVLEEGAIHPGQVIDLEHGKLADPDVADRLVGACPRDRICLYDTSSSSTYMVAHNISVGPYYCLYAGGANNKTSYIVNNSDALWRVYDATGCTGTYGPIYPNTSGAMNSTWNNNISSLQREAIP